MLGGDPNRAKLGLVIKEELDAAETAVAGEEEENEEENDDNKEEDD